MAAATTVIKHKVQMHTLLREIEAAQLTHYHSSEEVKALFKATGGAQPLLVKRLWMIGAKTEAERDSYSPEQLDESYVNVIKNTANFIANYLPHFTIGARTDSSDYKWLDKDTAKETVTARVNFDDNEHEYFCTHDFYLTLTLRPQFTLQTSVEVPPSVVPLKYREDIPKSSLVFKLALSLVAISGFSTVLYLESRPENPVPEIIEESQVRQHFIV